MAPVIPNPDHVQAFADAGAFEAWLSAHHQSASQIWLRIYKQNSDTATVTHAQALDVALCWGWIDGIRKSYDEASFLQRFTPRKPKSIWSQVNRIHVARLTEAGRMTEFGQRQVDAAKADGRWDAAYASGANMQTPADLLAAINANPAALATFQTLTQQNRFALAFRLGNVKTAATRAKKLALYVEMLARGETIYPNGQGGRRP